MKILIAEDDIFLQIAMKRFMNLWDYEFDMVSDGKEAIAQARKNEGKYDIGLMDIDMPLMNGYEATKIIRKKVKYFPIMALTANATIKDKYLEVGMDDFLEKPYDKDKLYDKINELTIKSFKFEINGEDIFIKKEMPMDQQHAQELRELKRQNLIKVKFDDISGSEVVVHKNIINKIVQDFNIKKQFVSTFLNRNPDKPTKCILFGNNCRMPQMYLDDEDYDKELRKEDEEVKKFPELILKVEKDT